MNQVRTHDVSRGRHVAVALLVAALLVIGACSLAPLRALAAGDAAVEEGVYQILGVGSGKPLDVEDNEMRDGTNVQILSQNRDYGQYWRLESVDGHYAIRNSLTGYALSVAGDGTASGTNVEISSYDAGEGQLWDVVANDDGSVTIVSALNGLCLDVAAGSKTDGANVQVYNPNGSAAQKWTLDRVERTVESGVYGITSAVDRSKAIDVIAASKDNGAKIQLWTANGTDAQKWGLTFDEETGFYTVVCAASLKAIDIPAADPSSGVKVQQYACNGSAAQLWSIVESGDGYEIRSALSGLVLDVPAALASEGTALQMYASNGSAAQRWSLTPESLDLDGVYQLESAVDGSKVLDIYAASTAEDAKVQVWGKNGSLAQKWEVTELEDGTHTIRNANSGRYLTQSGDSLVSSSSLADGSRWRVSVGRGGYVFENAASLRTLALSGDAQEGTQVVAAVAKSGPAQAWTPVRSGLVGEGYYVLANRAGSNQVLDVPAASSQSGVALQTYEANGTPAQTWLVESAGSGWYTISNAASGLALDVQYGVASSGTVVQQYDSNGSAAQRWSFSVAPGGGVLVTSALGDVALASADARPVSGSAAVVLTPGADVACGWSFNATSYVPDDATEPDPAPNPEPEPEPEPVPDDPAPSDDVSDVWGDPAYVAEMRSRAAQVGSSTGIVAVVDKGRDRTTVFRSSGDEWVLVNSMDVITSGNTFTGVHDVYIRARGYWKEPNCIDVNDWYVGFVEDWWSSPSSDNMRYVEGMGYDEGQGFHYGFYGSGCICIPDYAKAKWLYDNMSVGSTVYIF